MFFKRFLPPDFAFKAVFIGGGYATGSELADFFLPNRPWGGVLGMLLAFAVWTRGRFGRQGGAGLAQTT